MKKIAVIASGWHYSSMFYEKISKQHPVKNWEIDLFVVSHRDPEDINTIKEKDTARNYSGDDFYLKLDKKMYSNILTKQKLKELGWNYIEKPNTIGDMEVFNQWTDDYDYSKYNLFLVTHDDNYIISNTLFKDVLSNNIKLYKPILESRYGTANHQFKTELVDNNLDWDFLDNGYSEYISKAFTPRGSFSFYSKNLVDKLPNNKFNMYEDGPLGSLNRIGQTDSVGHEGITNWNTHAGTFRDFLYDNNFVDKTRWLSDTKRVSKYCIEGERGFIHNNNASEHHYKNAIKKYI